MKIITSLSYEMSHLFEGAFLNPIDIKDAEWMTKRWVDGIWLDLPDDDFIGIWMAKAAHEAASNPWVRVICARVPVHSDADWWHNYVSRANKVFFLKGIDRFRGTVLHAPFASAIVVWESAFKVKNEGTQYRTLDWEDDPINLDTTK